MPGHKQTRNYPLPISPVISKFPPNLTNNQLKGVGNSKDTFVKIVSLRKLLDVQQTLFTCATTILCP